jgi:oxygen-dependent protoporphyrinogen oxidase
MLGFLRQLGLEGELLPASPASRKRFLYRGGELVPVPLGPLGLATTPLLSFGARLRLLGEPFVARGNGASETVSEFIARRLGPEVAEALVGPFLTGVYAGDERQLGAEAVFPQLVELERDHGSLLGGALRRSMQRRQPRGTAGTWSMAEGLGSLSARLAERLAEPPLLGARVEWLAVEGSGVRVGAAIAGEGEEEFSARAVVLATSASAALQLLEPLDEDATAAIAAVEYAPIATVALGASAGSLRRPAEGFGFLVPRSEGLGLLGCLFMSQLYAGRAPAGRELLHCMLGGVRAPQLALQGDDALVEAALRDIDRVLGVSGEIETVTVRRWPRAVAQPGVGHRARIAAARAAVRRRAPIAIAGGYTDGVSVPDAFASGVAAAGTLAP